MWSHDHILYAVYDSATPAGRFWPCPKLPSCDCWNQCSILDFCQFSPIDPSMLRSRVINLECIFALIINWSMCGCWQNLEGLWALKVRALIALQWFWGYKIDFLWQASSCFMWSYCFMSMCLKTKNTFLILGGKLWIKVFKQVSVRVVVRFELRYWRVFGLGCLSSQSLVLSWKNTSTNLGCLSIEFCIKINAEVLCGATRRSKFPLIQWNVLRDMYETDCDTEISNIYSS